VTTGPFEADPLSATAWVDMLSTPARVYKIVITSTRIDVVTIVSAYFAILLIFLFQNFFSFLFHEIHSFLFKLFFLIKVQSILEFP
jgi:hypothetical protein